MANKNSDDKKKAESTKAKPAGRTRKKVSPLVHQRTAEREHTAAVKAYRANRDAVAWETWSRGFCGWPRGLRLLDDEQEQAAAKKEKGKA